VYVIDSDYDEAEICWEMIVVMLNKRSRCFVFNFNETSCCYIE